MISLRNAPVGLLLILLLFGIAGAQTTSSAPELRIVIYQPDAPVLGDPQLAGFMERFQKELQAAAPKLNLHFVPLDSLHIPQQMNDIGECRTFECGLRIGRLNRLDLMVVSRIERNGRGHYFESNVVSVLRARSLAHVEATVGGSLGELENIRYRLADSLGAAMQVSVKERGIEKERAADLLEGTPIDATVLSGTLTKEKSPYLVYGSLQVPAGEELVIDPDVVIRFVPGLFGGLTVYGQLQVNGTLEKPVRFESAGKVAHPWDWRGVLIAGTGRSTIAYLDVSGANYGVHVENSGLAMQNSHLHGNSMRGIFIRNSQVEIQDCQIDGNEVIGIQAGAMSQVNVTRTRVSGVGTAIAIMPDASVSLTASTLQDNDRGVLVLKRGTLITERNHIVANQVGIASSEKLARSQFEGVRDNATDLQQVVDAILPDGFEEPILADVRRQEIIPVTSWQVGEHREKELWSPYGNIQWGAAYRGVSTANNSGPLAVALEKDTVQPHHAFPNTFFASGPSTFGNAFLVLESNQGRSIEFQGEGLADTWNHGRFQPFSLRYGSKWQNFTVGNFQESSSPLLLSSFGVLGVKYQLHLGQSERGDYRFQVDGFYGETREPFAGGSRNPETFGQYYAADGAVSQQMTTYGHLGFAPFGQWNFSVASIVAKDRTSNLVFRKELPEGAETRDPLTQSRAAMFGSYWHNPDRSWTAQMEIAVGQADTSDVFYQAALDEVFANAGLEPVALSDVRTLFLSDARVQDADSATVFAILSPDSLTLAQARDSLVVLRHQAMAVEAQTTSSAKKGRAGSLEWNPDNMAGRFELDWNGERGNFRASMQSVGSAYASPGAAGLGQNLRDYELAWSQGITSFWDLDAEYHVTVENASGPESNATNVLGLGEGSWLGIWRDSSWHENHLMDAGRARLEHQASVSQAFRLGSAVDLSLGYQFSQSHQFLPTKLKVDYSPGAAVALDPWFAARNGKSTTRVDMGYGDSTTIDAERWAEYLAQASEETVAWGFDDRRVHHGFSGELQWRRATYTIRLGVTWNGQWDRGYFTHNLLDSMDLADTTLEKLGHNPEAQTWNELAYPMSISGKFGDIAHKVSFAPRWKQWQKANLHEYEYRLNDRLELPLQKRKIILSFNGELANKVTRENGNHYYLQARSGSDSTLYPYYRIDTAHAAIVPVLTSDARANDLVLTGGEDVGDSYRVVRQVQRNRTTQTDWSAEFSFRYNWTAHFYSELLGNILQTLRPDQLENENTSWRAGGSVFYSF